MSLPVWPSDFIRFAVAILFTSSTLRGRPNFVPLTRDASLFNAVRSLISPFSYSAKDPRTPIIMRPAGVDESMPSVLDTRVMPYVSDRGSDPRPSTLRWIPGPSDSSFVAR